MRSPAPLALLLAPLLACFTDGGTATVASSPGGPTSEPATQTTEADPGTEGDPATTGTATTATTDAPTTDVSTTDVPTTAAPTTDPLGNCAIAPECEAGAVEDGELCGACGVMRRSCQGDCTWTPQSCEQDLSTCSHWYLPPGETTWKRLPVDPQAALAPSDTVLAAVGLEPVSKIYVLTASTYHVLSTANNSWIAAGPRDALFPEFAGQPLYHAAGLANDPPDVIVHHVAGTRAYNYTYKATQDFFAYEGQVDCCGANWTGINAPDPYAVRDGWGRIGDPQGWIPGDVQTLCGLDEPVPLYGYQLSIGDGFVYPQDIGYCFDFYPPIPFAQFTPFSYPGAPANELIGGAAYVDGLWIFRGQ